MVVSSDVADRCGPPVAVFRSPGFSGVRFECRPMSRIPPDKTIAFLYKVDGTRLVQSGVGVFADGAWRRSIRGGPIKGDYLWTALVNE